MNLFALQKEFVKTIIRDTVETYSGQWRLIHEAIQNSHDHIQLNRKINRGKIEIDLFVGRNIVSVKDNGTGIAIEKFQNIFLLGGSDKTDAPLRKILKGSQGVGIKSTLFTSKTFKVETVYGEDSWEYEIDGCYRFYEGGFNVEIEPPTTKPSRLPSGSVFTYSIHDYSVQDFLTEIVNEYCEETLREEIPTPEELKTVIETYFRSKTYLGCVQVMLGINSDLKPIDVEVTLHFDFPSLEEHRKINIERCSFLADQKYYQSKIQVAFPGKYLDIGDLHSNLRPSDQADKLYEDFEDVLNNPPDQTIRKILVQKFDKATVKRLLTRPKRTHQTGKLSFEPDQALLRKHKSVLDRINGLYLVIGQRTYLAKYFHIGARQIISVNGLPTNISLNLPHGALSYLNNVYIVLAACRREQADDAQVGHG